MTEFTYEDLKNAEDKGFSLGFYSCWSWFQGEYGSVHNEDDKTKLKRIDVLLKTAFSTALEFLDLDATGYTRSAAKGWLKHYEKEAEGGEAGEGKP